jgi:hypothetical protein
MPPHAPGRIFPARLEYSNFGCYYVYSEVVILEFIVAREYFPYGERDFKFMYGIVYSCYACFLFQWVYPYAFFTVQDRRWLTR